MFFNQNKINIPARDNALPGREMPIQTAETHYILGRKLKAPFPDQMEIAVFGLGCFWGAERKFWSQDGIWVSSVLASQAIMKLCKLCLTQKNFPI